VLSHGWLTIDVEPIAEHHGELLEPSSEIEGQSYCCAAEVG
jgi:hypothetical protein